MQFQVPGYGLSDPGTNGWQAKTFMGGNPVTAIETPKLTINLQQINRFAQTLLGIEAIRASTLSSSRNRCRGLRTEANGTWSTLMSHTRKATEQLNLGGG